MIIGKPLDVISACSAAGSAASGHVQHGVGLDGELVGRVLAGLVVGLHRDHQYVAAGLVFHLLQLLAEFELRSGAVAGRVMALVAADFLQREQQFLELQLRRVFHVILPKKILSKAKKSAGGKFRGPAEECRALAKLAVLAAAPVVARHGLLLPVRDFLAGQAQAHAGHRDAAASGISLPHSAQWSRLGPVGSWLLARSMASFTVASICSCTAPSCAHPVAMLLPRVRDACPGRILRSARIWVNLYPDMSPRSRMIARMLALSLAFWRPRPGPSAVPRLSQFRGAGRRTPLPADWNRPAGFVVGRLMYPSGMGGFRGFRGFGGDWRQGGTSWAVDYPRGDRSYAKLLRRLTTIDVRSVEQPVNLEDGDDVFDWPYLMVGLAGYWDLDDDMGRNCVNTCCAAVLFGDSFFGDGQWEGFSEGMRRIFPDRQIVDLPDDHEIFHVVYDLDGKGGAELRGVERPGRVPERRQPPHWRGVLDDQGRVMVAIAFNNDCQRFLPVGGQSRLSGRWRLPRAAHRREFRGVCAESLSSRRICAGAADSRTASANASGHTGELPMNARLTASQLYSHLICPHRVAMDAAGDPALRDEASPFVQLLWERGVAHERELISSLGVPCLDLSSLSGEAKEAATREAIARREPLIYSGRLSVHELLGEPDLLRLESGGYVAIDIKSGAGRESAEGEEEGRLRRHYGVQLALYTDILEQMGLVGRPLRLHLGCAAASKPAMTSRRRWGPGPAACGSCYLKARAAVRATLAAPQASTAGEFLGLQAMRVARGLFLAAEARRRISRCCPSWGARRAMRCARNFPRCGTWPRADVEHTSRRPHAVPGWARNRCAASSAAPRCCCSRMPQPYLTRPVAWPRAQVELFFDIETDPLRELCYLHGFVIREGGDSPSERFEGIFASDITAKRRARGLRAAMECSAVMPTRWWCTTRSTSAPNTGALQRSIRMSPRQSRSKRCSGRRARWTCTSMW